MTRYVVEPDEELGLYWIVDTKTDLTVCFTQSRETADSEARKLAVQSARKAQLNQH